MTGARRAAALGVAVALLTASARADGLAGAAARAAADALARMLVELSLQPPSVADDEGPLHPELSAWVDPATNSTSRMTQGCGLLVETTLRTSASRNVLHVVAANESDGLLRFTPLQVRFSSGVTRAMGGTAALAKTARNTYSFGFPRKQDFAGQRWLEVVLGVQSRAGWCQFTIRHERAQSIAQSRESLIAYSDLEFWIGGGLRFEASGGLGELGRDEGLALEFGLARFFTPNHGLTADLLSDQATSSPGSRAAGFGYALGYAARVYPLSWLSVSYGPSLGLMRYSTDQGAEQTQVFVFQQRLRVQARVLPQISGRFGLYFAPSLTTMLVGDGQLGGVQLRGSSAAALLSVGFGL